MPALALFTSDELSVKRVTLPSGTLPGSVTIGGLYSGSRSQASLGLEDDGVLIVGVDTADSVSFNLAKSLGNQYYMYLFGDSPVAMTVRGLCVPSESCDPATGSSYDNLFAFYTAFKASGRAKSSGDFPQVTISFSGRVITGLLVGMSVSQSDLNQRVAAFALNIIGIKDVQSARPSTVPDSDKPINLAASGMLL